MRGYSPFRVLKIGGETGQGSGFHAAFADYIVFLILIPRPLGRGNGRLDGPYSILSTIVLKMAQMVRKRAFFS
jgi:hypothetical protein